MAGPPACSPNLKRQIEGHTDSIGKADHNLDLSKRRAAAVKAVLEFQRHTHPAARRNGEWEGVRQ